jgi:hypothetical protein
VEKMATFRYLYTSFWSDPKVADKLSVEEKLLMIYLLTNNSTNLIGCYEISLKQISHETGFSVETVINLLEKQKKTHKMIYYDENTNEVFYKKLV